MVQCKHNSPQRCRHPSSQRRHQKNIFCTQPDRFYSVEWCRYLASGAMDHRNNRTGFFRFSDIRPNHHIIGQLFGGSSACGLPASQQIDFYGKFATSWNNGSMPSLRLRDWLDPDNTLATVLDGYEPNVALAFPDA